MSQKHFKEKPGFISHCLAVFREENFLKSWWEGHLREGQKLKGLKEREMARV